MSSSQISKSKQSRVVTTKVCDCVKLRVPKEITENVIYLGLYNLLVSFFDTNGYSDFESLLYGIDNQETYQVIFNKVTSFIGDKDIRAIISDPDGRVLIDTSKTNNSYENYSANAIGDNRNARAEFMAVQLLEGGVSYATKFSNYRYDTQSYVTMRIGNFRDNAGSISFSTSGIHQENHTCAPTRK